MFRRKIQIAVVATALLAMGGAIAALADPDPSGELAARAATVSHTGAGGASASAGARAGSPCGQEAAAVVAQVDGQIAERIYADELRGGETSQDRRQIAGYPPLIAALRSGQAAAIRTAVHELVYSGTHIVRLRVTHGSKLLADIGGPYIIAPATGSIRSGGRTLARFSFSVQDDLGFIKLVTRFVGVPLVLRTSTGQIPVEGQATGAPAKIADSGAVPYRGATFQAFSFTARAYPQGTLRVSLLSPPRTGLGAASCAQVRALELARVAARIARRFKLGPSNLHVYAEFVHTLTLAKVVITAGGRTYLTGGGRAPRKLPATGPVTIGGHRYEAATLQVPTSVGTAREWVLLPG